jgi:HK97 family phage prohead protease
MSANQLVFLRAFPAQIEQTGPRQLTGRLVPYNEPTDVLDQLPGGELDIYREGFRPGAFGPQANITEKGVLSKISLIHRHEGGLGYLGPFTALREAPDGLYGTVNVLRSRASDVEDLLAEGVDELSVEFRLPRANHTEVDGDGIRWRTRAHLDQVALEPKGAYSQARVLAYRAQVDEETREAAEAERKAEAERQAAEAEAEARRQRWEQLTGRLDQEKARQVELIKAYGITQPGGFGTVQP